MSLIVKKFGNELLQKTTSAQLKKCLDTLKMGFIKNGLWRSPIEEINRYLSPEEELEFKKFYMKKFRLERRMWLKLFRNCPSLKNMDEPKSQKITNFSATKMSLFWINGLTVILCFTKFFVCVWIIETVNTEHGLDLSSIQGIEILINSRNSYLRTCFRSELGSV